MDNINGISKLEANILLVVWDNGNTTNREVYDVFLIKELKEKDSSFTPYTTIMSTMNNPAKKNILEINQSQKTYIYSVGLSRKELTKSIIKAIAEKLL